MYIQKAVINYAFKLEVQIDCDGMDIKGDDGQRMWLGPDEFRDLIELARLMGWELRS